MSGTPYDLNLYISDVDLEATIKGYEQMRHCLFAMQVALARKSAGTHAFSLCWAANYLLRDLISTMPTWIVVEWARLDELTIDELFKEQPGG